MNRSFALASFVVLAACGSEPSDIETTDVAQPEAETAAEALHMYVLDCGTIEVSDLDIFSTAGDYAGQSDVFTDACFLIRHPDGDLMWDLGLPGILAGAEPQENGVFTVSLERTLTDQLTDIGLAPSDIEYVSISHSHFDHVGQIDQFVGAQWIVHEDEYAAMFPQPGEGSEEDTAGEGNQFIVFEGFETVSFTGEYDVFGDGTVVIVPAPGHTPGHTVLQVTLPETGPVLLTGDLYHRSESRDLGRIPRFNADEAQSAASIEAFEARAADLGAKVIIQHEPADIDPLPKPPEAMR